MNVHPSSEWGEEVTPLWSQAELTAFEGALARAALDQAARLLATRASGIALSRLGGENEDPSRFRTHIHEALLACGDALLLERGAYVSTYARRAQSLTMLARREPELEALSSAYDDARFYGLHPDRWLTPSHERAWRERRIAMVRDFHLRFEARRLGIEPTLLGVVQLDRPLFELAPAVGPRHLAAAAEPALGTPPPEKALIEERLARASMALAYAPHNPRARAVAARWMGVYLVGDAQHDDTLLAAGIESLRAQMREP